MQCPNCSGELPDSSRYCHHCHTLFKPVTDPNAAAAVPAGPDGAGADAGEPVRDLKPQGYSMFSPKGRLNRAKYLYFSLMNYVGQVLLYTGLMFFLANGESSWLSYAFYAILSAMTVVQIMTVVKRLHDIGKPGHHFLLLLVPLINIYMFIRLLFEESQPGDNIYGGLERNSWYWQTPATVLAIPALLMLAAAVFG